MKPATVHYGARRTAWGRIWVALGEDGVLAVALGSDPVGKLSEDVRARIADEGGELLPSTPEQQAADIDQEERKWGALVRKLGLKVE